MTDSQQQPQFVLFRKKIKKMEKSELWYCQARNIPGRQMIMPLRQPFMNFKEGREVLAKHLGRDPLKVKFAAQRGARTYYPDQFEIMKLTEEKPPEVVEEEVKKHEQAFPDAIPAY